MYKQVFKLDNIDDSVIEQLSCLRGVLGKIEVNKFNNCLLINSSVPIDKSDLESCFIKKKPNISAISQSCSTSMVLSFMLNTKFKNDLKKVVKYYIPSLFLLLISSNTCVNISLAAYCFFCITNKLSTNLLMTVSTNHNDHKLLTFSTISPIIASAVFDNKHLLLIPILNSIITAIYTNMVISSYKSYPNTFISNSCNFIKSPTEIERVNPNTLENGDLVLIEPGETFPTDGTILSGFTYTNETNIDGQQNRILKKDGANIPQGTINLSNRVIFVSTKQADYSITHIIRNGSTTIQQPDTGIYKANNNIYSAIKYILYIQFSFALTSYYSLSIAATKVAQCFMNILPFPFLVTDKLIDVLIQKYMMYCGIMLKKESINKLIQARSIVFTKDFLTSKKSKITDFYIPKQIAIDISSHPLISKHSILLMASSMQSRCNISHAQALFDFYVKQSKPENPESSLEAITSLLMFISITPNEGVEAIFKGSKVSCGSVSWISKRGKIDFSSMREWISYKTLEGQHIKIIALDGVAVAAFSFTDVINEQRINLIKQISRPKIKLWLLPTPDKANNIFNVCVTYGINVIGGKYTTIPHKSIVIHTDPGELPVLTEHFTNISVSKYRIPEHFAEQLDACVHNTKDLLKLFRCLKLRSKLKRLNLLSYSALMLISCVNTHGCSVSQEVIHGLLSIATIISTLIITLL